jgi:hypothetical protein
LNIDERFMNRELKLALERSWAHVGDTIVRTHTSPQDADPYNFIQVLVKYGTRRYLLSADEDADANWTERMEKHLSNTFAKVGNNTKIYNRNQRKGGHDEVAYDHIDLELESGSLVLQFRLDSNSDLPVACAHIATRIRKFLNEGGWGENLRRVIIPSLESYQQQEAAFLERLPQREAERAAEEQSARQAAEEARIRAEREAEEQFLESPELAQEFEGEQDEEAREKVEVLPLTAEEWEAAYGFDDADFEIDYRVWELVYEDGSSRVFDSSKETFIP